MPFSKINVKEEIARRKSESKSFANEWDETKEEYRLIGEMIALRKQTKTTQIELAKITGNKQQVISRIEKHESVPSLKTFCNILDALGYKLKIEKKVNRL